MHRPSEHREHFLNLNLYLRLTKTPPLDRGWWYRGVHHA